MPLLPVDWLYRRLRRHYPVVFFVLQLSVGTLVTATTLWLVSFYYDASAQQLLDAILAAEALTLAALAVGFARVAPRLRPIKAWIQGARDRQASLAAWEAAVNLPMRAVRQDVILPAALVVVPVSASTAAAFDQGWTAIVPLSAAGAVAIAYGAVLQYFAIELGLRPVVDEVAAHLPEEFEFRRRGLPLRVKLVGMVPLFSVVTGLTVAALTSDEGSSLGVSVAVTLAVAFTLGVELTLLLTTSILRPLGALREGMASVREGRYDVRVPVTTNDEVGELADGFNRMTAGLAERERLREAFGTYLDKEVAEYILSQEATPRGVELEVSVLFCDVRGFTAFAARSEATEVVSCLNRLYEAIVPIVARHGGHVDKFVGDGLLAVFGAPEPFRDHADRAVAAGCEMVRVTEAGEAGDLRIGVGINCGRVVAGSIGGGGRLNFSVIGDAVNVAARVEAATRETGDSLLLTAEVRDRLTREVPLVRRGEVLLPGRDAPTELFALAREAVDSPARAAVASSA
jgi:class 3 adenylate cyclase